MINNNDIINKTNKNNALQAAYTLMSRQGAEGNGEAQRMVQRAPRVCVKNDINISSHTI